MSTKLEKGKISVIMVTYNRGYRIRESIDSLLDQTYENFEIIIIDNGSTDETSEVLDTYRKPEFAEIIKLHRIEVNNQFTPAANLALGLIRGEWFTFLDDDDTAMSDAFEIMMDIPLTKDPKITAVICNCLDSSTGKLTGKGLYKDQYLSFEDTVKKCTSEFWGITRTELLKDYRLNEYLRGYEDTFWYKVSAHSNRYYIHKALRVWNTEGVTITNTSKTRDLKVKAELYRTLAEEDFYWKCLSSYRPKKFLFKSLKGLIYLLLNDDIEGANKYYKMLSDFSTFTGMVARIPMLSPKLLRWLYNHAPYS